MNEQTTTGGHITGGVQPLENTGGVKEVENSKNNSSWGGAREGAGRKKGGENEETKKKRIAKKEMIDRIIRSKDSLLNSQMNLAQGVQMLYRIEKDSKGNNKKPELVTSQAEIEEYLAGEYEGGDEYYFITTERPDNRALDSLLDRTFGKAQQNMDVTSKGESITVNILRNGDNNTPQL